MNPEPTTVHSTSLYFRGPFGSEYHAAVEPRAEGFIVTFAVYRRGDNLTVGSKTPKPLPLEAAIRMFEKLVASKLAKGFHSCFPSHS
jgi:hypothetical protein